MNILDKDVSLIGNIYDLMGSDDDNPNLQSEILVKTYIKSTKKEKERINLCFIALCGYSLETLILEQERTAL